MNDYIFFDASLSDRFLGFIDAYGLTGNVRADQIDGFVVALPDDLADDIQKAIEDEYEALMAEQQSLVEAEENNGAQALMEIAVALPDGQLRNVRIPALYARRLHDQFTVQEIHELVSAIAESVVNPVDGPMCQSC
jgi:hypothetical protein